MHAIRRFLIKHHLWDIFWYAFFGGWTTVINIATFAAVTRLGMAWQPANLLAWLLAVLFAFVTNKLWVFHSHTSGAKALIWEFGKFIVARVLSLGLDYACMYLFIDGFNWSTTWAKLLTQVVIIVVNYVLSKWLIFISHESRG